ncbi:UNVERIFIED_CONTAM: hypothetical protein HDU68_000272 [Siphonaria sp. JEL0065]|nr:hypothetical protein HDU68_000272 [Siphonaria sp. JEL0065]
MPLQGKNIVFTGTLQMNRAEATKLAHAYGGTVLASLSKAANLVVAGKDVGSQLDKAEAQGIEVWSEEQFLDAVNTTSASTRSSPSKSPTRKKGSHTASSFGIASLPTECFRAIAKAAAATDPKSVFVLAATCKKLRGLLSFEDDVFWKHLILTAFDFSDPDEDDFEGSHTFYMNDDKIYIELEETDLETGEEMFGEVFDRSEAVGGDEPPYLLEKVRVYTKVGTHGFVYRPSQYGFLKSIQQGTVKITAWPENEEPVSLYKDLVYISKILTPAFDTIDVGGEGGGQILPTLLPQTTEPSPEEFPGYLLKTVGYNPYVWSRAGLPLETEKSFDILRNQDCEPIMSMSHVDGNFKDYVEDQAFYILNPNEGSDGGVPMFTVGRSKISGRWPRKMGLIGKLKKVAEGKSKKQRKEEEDVEEEWEEENEEEGDQEEYDEEECDEDEEDDEEEEAEEEEEDEEDEEDEEEEEEEDVEEEEVEEEENEEEEEEEEYDVEPPTAKLPKGWVAQYSNEYNCYFYCNTKTGETQWHAPGTIPPTTTNKKTDAKKDPYQLQHNFRGTGNKKALLIGINYTGTDNELSGCINDAHNLKEFIVENYGYSASPESMLMLTDDAKDKKKRPTLKNMLAGFVWLVSNTNPGDELFFSYSGHGGQIDDDDNDRESGLDCTLCPVDFDTAGEIRSDDCHKYLVAALPEGVKLTIIMDCCHSGTMMELPYTYRPDANGKMNPVDLLKKGITIAVGAQKLLQGGFSMGKLNDAKRLFEEAKTLAAAFGGKEGNESGYKEEGFNENSGAPKLVFCLSGCRDEQTSADAEFNGKASGALTYAILKALEANMNLSYQELLVQLREFMKGEFSQIPQLSCGTAVDPNSPFSM